MSSKVGPKSQYDFKVTIDGSIAAVTITDLRGEGAAERVHDVLAEEFEGIRDD